MLASFTLTLGAHTFEHAAVYFFRQIDGLDPDIDHFDTQLFFRHFVQRCGDVSHQCITLTRHHFVQGALTELVTQTGFQTTGQTLVGDLLQTGSRGVEALGIFHPPLGISVDHYGFLFQGQETLCRCIQRHQTCVEFTHLVNVRHFHMQAWLNIGLNHTTELQQHRTLGLSDDVEAVPAHQYHNDANDQGDQRFIAHQRVSLVRDCGRSVTCGVTSVLLLAAAEPVTGALLPELF
ncbi:hypothetical protein D3C71_1039990 [compost metagenome]